MCCRSQRRRTRFVKCPNCGDRIPYRRLVRLTNWNARACRKCGLWLRVANRRRAALIGAAAGGLGYATMYWILYSSFSLIAVITFMLVLAFALCSVNLLKLEVGARPQAPTIPWRADVVQAGVLRLSFALIYLAGVWFAILGVIGLAGRNLLVSLGLAPISTDPASIAEYSGALMRFNLILEAITVPAFIILCYLMYSVGSNLKINALRLSGILGVGLEAVMLGLTPVAIQTQTGYELLYPMNIMFFLHFNDLLVVAFDALGAGFLITFAGSSLIMNDKTRISEYTVAGLLTLISVFLMLVLPLGLVVFGSAVVTTGLGLGKLRRLSFKTSTSDQHASKQKTQTNPKLEVA